MKLSRETAIISAICLADLVTTLWLVRGHGADEANPLMRPFLEQGIVAFVLAKFLFCLGPLALLEWARRQHPVFVQAALRTGIALYVGFYGMVVWRINHEPDDYHFTDAQTAAIESYAAQPTSQEEIAAIRTRIARQ